MIGLLSWLISVLRRLLERELGLQAKRADSEHIVWAPLGEGWIIVLLILYEFYSWDDDIIIWAQFYLLFRQLDLKFSQINALLFQDAISILVVVPGDFFGDKAFILNLRTPELGLTKHFDGL